MRVKRVKCVKMSFFEFCQNSILGWVLTGMSSYMLKSKVWCFEKSFAPKMNPFRLIFMESWFHKFCEFFFRKFVGSWLLEWISTWRWWWWNVWYWGCGKDDVTSSRFILFPITRCFWRCTLKYVKILIFTEFHVWISLLAWSTCVD